jgi:hypothetical protein
MIVELFDGRPWLHYPSIKMRGVATKGHPNNALFEFS